MSEATEVKNETIEIPVIKGKRGRAKTEISKDVFTDLIQIIESGGPLKSRSEVFETIATKYNDIMKTNITVAIVTARIAEWNIVLKTPISKVGRAAGATSKKSNITKEAIILGLKDVFNLTAGNNEAQEIVIHLLKELDEGFDASKEFIPHIDNEEVPVSEEEFENFPTVC